MKILIKLTPKEYQEKRVQQMGTMTFAEHTLRHEANKLLHSFGATEVASDIQIVVEPDIDPGFAIHKH